MKNYIKFLDKYKLYIIIFTTLLVVGLGINLKNLAFEGSYRIWFAQDSKILKDYDHFRAVFGNDDALTIFIENKNGIFNKKTLNIIQNISDDLWETKFISRVDSIINYQDISSIDDDIIIENFIPNIDYLEKDDLKKLKNKATTNEDLLNAFINKNGTITMISARIGAKVGQDEDYSFELMDYVEKILAKYKDEDLSFRVNGGAAMTKAFVLIAMKDAATFTPLVFLSIALLLYILFRNIWASFLPMIVILYSIIIVVSVQLLLGFKLNNFTANIAVFIAAIAIADSVHILSIYQRYKKTHTNYEAISLTLQKNILAIFLTSLTTAVGFFSLAISHIIPVKTLGIATASGAVIAFILSVSLLPAMLLYLDKLKIKDAKRVDLDKFYEWYSFFIVKNSKKIILIFSLFFLLLGAGLINTKFDSNIIKYFKEDVPLRQNTQWIMDNLTGPMSYEIVVDSKINDGIKKTKFLQTVQKFYNEFQNEFKDVRHIYSLLDIIKKFNKTINGKNSVPASDELIAQYLLLYSMSLPQGLEINDKMDIKQRYLRVTVQTNLVNSTQDLAMIDWIESWWKNTPYSAKVNGQTAMFAYMQMDVTKTLIYSLTIALILVSVMMLIIFRNLKMLFIFILPNVLPVVLVFGIMGWLGIYIDLGVAVSAAIVLGIAVDDTIHFFVKYFDAQNKGLKGRELLLDVFKHSGNAIIFTTIILVLSFSIFMISDFAPNFNFGLLTASALSIALLADLVLLPAVLLNSKQ